MRGLYVDENLLWEVARPEMKIDPVFSHPLFSHPLSPHPRLDPASLSSDTTPLRQAPRIWLRRLCFWAPVVSATALGTLLGAIATHGVASPLRLPLLALLALNLAYMALVGTPAVIGFVLHVARRKMRVNAAPSGLSSTAILMPVHREDPRAVFAAIEVMARAIGEAKLANVDLFVLSDTQDPVIAAQEKAAFEAMVSRAPAISGAPGLFYRRRPDNAGRKAGNLAEFCQRWGSNYDYMLVLDADSLMGASAIGKLIGLMDANPRAGIIQTVPYAIGRETLFGRVLQFSARLYTPLLIEGLTFWQQSDGNYWGHNAILRIAPFQAHCVLPVLPGAEPWGGEILCHDVVEAGLMRGAGWDVWVLPEVLESYEAVPANLVDYTARERRWCQGNLQHCGVLRLPGFRPVGRFHLAYGVTHYLSAPAAVLFLLLATIDALCGGGFAAALLTNGPAAAGLVTLGAVLLYAGKVLTLVAALANRSEARKFGGRLALLSSAALEQMAACVIVAMLIVSYAGFVLELLAGRTVRWETQARDDRGVGWAEAWLRTRRATLVGAAWLVALPLLPHGVRNFTLPLLVGLLATWPLTVLSSQISLGAWTRRMKLLLTPDETAPTAIVRAYQRAKLSPEIPLRSAPSVGALQLVGQAGEAD